MSNTGKNIYVGRRYVPKLYNDGNGGAQWNKNVSFESLIIVTDQGNSYTSRQDVPIGIDINNKLFWVKTSDYNAQVAIYEQNVRDYHQYVIDQIGIINTDNESFKTEQQTNFDNLASEQQTNFDNFENDINTKLTAIAFINVKDFGAKGDYNGTIKNDDTIPIQTAINTANGNDEVVLTKGKYYITSTITFKANAKIKFDGAEIITDSTFIGDCVFQCNSVFGDGHSHGYMLNAKFNSIEHATNATALQLDYIQNFRISNFVSLGYIKGGINQKSGYELFLNTFEIVAPTTLPSRNFPSLQYGIYLYSDNAISNGSIVAYPVGLRTHGNNDITNCHCWGIPSTGNIDDTRIMLYPFICDEKGNNLVNCFADTPDLLDITGSTGGTNGGIGFFDADTSISASAYPTQNSYINCRVLKHASSVANKIIGFQYGDGVLNGGNNSIGNYTKIIAPTFQGTGYLQNIKCNNITVNKTACIIDNTQQNFIAPTIVSGRVTNLTGGYIQSGGMVYINVKFTSAITLDGTIPLQGFSYIGSSIIPTTLLNCINITDNVIGFANINSTSGFLNANLVSGKVYSISGWYSII